MSHPDVRYEKSDANVRTILACGIGLIFVGLVVQFATAWLFDAMKESVHHEDGLLATLAAKERTELPRDLARIPSPVLQQNEGADLQRIRKKEAQRLNSYGWIDKKTGIVHIPIAEAIRLLADPTSAEAHGIRVEIAPKK